MAHRFVEWDGWEEGLIDTILGPEDDEDRWLSKDHDTDGEDDGSHGAVNSPPVAEFSTHSFSNGTADVNVGARANIGMAGMAILQASMTRRKPSSKLPLPIAQEKQKEQMLNTTGDYCGGRGGELGRRLEAWLTVNGIENGQVHSPLMARWDKDHETYSGDHLEVGVVE
jgi:putative hemolysin